MSVPEKFTSKKNTKKKELMLEFFKYVSKGKHKYNKGKMAFPTISSIKFIAQYESIRMSLLTTVISMFSQSSP